MVSQKDDKVTTIEAAAAAASTVQTSQDLVASAPTTAETRIHWANTQPSSEHAATLERKFEAMRDRNWVTEKMVQQYQKHWHCSRQVALERLIAKVGG